MSPEADLRDPSAPVKSADWRFCRPGFRNSSGLSVRVDRPLKLLSDFTNPFESIFIPWLTDIRGSRTQPTPHRLRLKKEFLKLRLGAAAARSRR